MLVQLDLKNFRGFNEHIVPLRPTTIIVGPNNAGKSTIVEALRLIALVAGRLRSLTFREPPDWLVDHPGAAPGVSPSLQGTGIDLSAVFHQYRDPPAIVTARFSTGATITVFVGPEGAVHSVIRDGSGALVAQRAQAYRADLDAVATQPQVAPVQREERLLAEETVRRNLSSTLASSHFRNQLWHFEDPLFEAFCELAEETWPGFAVDDLLLEGQAADPERPLLLLVRDGAFVGELALMGQGLQMWLQTMWFLTRAADEDAVILDEPDVYMHPDLQRRLIRLLRGRHQQTIVATHSVEIMAEAEPDNVLVINAGAPTSRFVTETEGVQRVVDRLGGVHNLQLARLTTARRCILVEGDDLEFLERFQTLLFPHSSLPFDNVPNMSIGGWSGWSYAVGSSMFLRNAAGQDITVYCVLDSDYHPPEVLAERRAGATNAGVELHIWTKKEIENYLVIPTAIQRVIAVRVARRTSPPSVAEVTSKIDELASTFRDDVLDAVATECLARDRASGLRVANRAARQYVDPAWQTAEGRLARVSGKAMLSALSGWSQTEFGVSFGPNTILAEMQPNEVGPEVARVVRAVEENQPL
jgi:hypothetical protein